MNLTANREKINTLIFTLSITLVITAIKFISFFLTHSNAILTDALESIINVVAGGFALFAAWFSSLPKDEGHPYGHGKIEFLSAGIEGALVFLAGAAIIAKAIYGIYYPMFVHSLDLGLIMTSIAGLANFALARFLISRGRHHNSLLMIADGKHLMSDTMTSAGLVLGIAIIWLTDMVWLDNVVAIIFGALILLTGYKLVKESLAGLLDETDYELLKKIIVALENNRVPGWIDFHNMRVLKYGASLHIDCHITLPWYLTLEEAHHQVELVEQIFINQFEQIELFVHSDPCIPDSCTVCCIPDCKVRQMAFVKKIGWRLDNLMQNVKHKA